MGGNLPFAKIKYRRSARFWQIEYSENFFFDELQVSAESADTLETMSNCSNGNAVAFKALERYASF